MAASKKSTFIKAEKVSMKPAKGGNPPASELLKKMSDLSRGKKRKAM